MDPCSCERFWYKGYTDIYKRREKMKSWLAKLVTKGKNVRKTSDVDLQQIHDKFFDKSGKMKQKGKDIVKKGLKGLK